MSDNSSKVIGQVEWALRNADGSIAQEGEGTNLVVDNGRLFVYHQDNENYPVGRYLFIANDNHDVIPIVNQLDSAVGTDSNFANVRLDTGTGGWNRSTLTRTVSGTFTAPISTRTVTHIGLAFGTAQFNGTTASGYGTHGQLFSALKIDPPITQTTSQTLEVTYKVIVLPNSVKTGQRFPPAGRDTERNFLEGVLVDHMGGPSGHLAPYTFGKYHFIDGGALLTAGFDNNLHYKSNWVVQDGSPPSYAGQLAPSIPAFFSDGTTRLAATDGFYNGAFGMTVAHFDPNDKLKDQASFINFVESLTLGYAPLAHDWGKVGPLVFPHPVGRTFMFNETAIDKTGQGDLEIQGPYIPKDAGSGAPAHWAYQILICDSGDTDPGTEGTYVFDRMAWFSYPYTRNASLRTSTNTFTYVANDGGSGNSAITQATGDFRHTTFFMPDSRLEVSGTASNNGTTYRIIKVEPLKLTLEGVVLTDEGPVSSTISAIDLFRPNGNGDRLNDGSNGTQGWRTIFCRVERDSATEGTQDTRYNQYRQVWDGIDSFWGIRYRNLQGDGSRYTLVRWRAMTGEQEFAGAPNPYNKGYDAASNGNPLTDTTRFVKHSDGGPIGLGNNTNEPYALASNRQGLVFYGQRNSNGLSADNAIFIIDNSKPGRWYQRTTGSIDGSGNFTVDADDDIHAMFPFVSGDAGATPKIRIVGSANGNNGVYSIASFTNANQVVLSGSFTPETGLTWHWTTVDVVEPNVGDLRNLVYDTVNGRLWAMGLNGIKHSDDDGQTWSTLLDENTATTPLIDAESRFLRVGSISHGHGSHDIDPNGDIYWISVNTGGTNKWWLNKLELNSGIGVDAVHSRVNLTDDFPGANKPPSIDYVVWEKGVDNPNGLGALWIMSADTSSTRYSWYRMTIDPGTISSQVANIVSHNPNNLLDVDISTNFKTANVVIALPSGKTFLRSLYTSDNGWLLFDPRFADDPNNAYWNFGENIKDDNVFMGCVGQEGFREDGCFWLTMEATYHGYFGSMGQLHRYAPAANVGGQSGAAASIVAGAPAGQIRIQGLTGMTANSVGRYLELSGAANAANNNAFIIMAQNSATEVDVYAPKGVTGDGNNGSISWQEKNAEWVQWEGTENQFNAYYNTATGGRRPMHADFRELRDNVQIKFTQAGGATAPVDEFVEGEAFSFVASFGEHKTNVEDMFVTFHYGVNRLDRVLEGEAIKTADGPGGLVAYFQSDTALTVPSPVALEPTYRLDANGKNWGWEPNYYYMLYGNGLSIDSDPTDGSTRPSWRAGLDLGSATEIHKLVVTVAYGTSGFDTNGNLYFSQTHANRCTDMRIYSGADPSAVPAEIDATLRWPASTNALGKHIYVNQGSIHNYRGYSSYQIIIDLAGAGLSAGQRTARFWEVVAAHATASSQAVILGGIWALDINDEVIGLTANHRLDEAYDPDFATCFIEEAFWIQNVHGGGDPGAGTTISTTDDGDGDGYTNTVTLDSGLFDTANIDITKDFLAWQEPGAPASSGYLRTTDRPGQPSPRSLSSATSANTTARPYQGAQAMSRIIDISTPGQIVVEDDMIPDNLSGAQWEIRRPILMNTTRSSTDPDAMTYDHGTGFFSHQPANEPPTGSARRFRITRKSIFRK